MTLKTRPLAPTDRPEWERLFAGYAEFYKVDQTPDMRETVFGWLMDDTHSSNCIVAEDAQGTVIGFTHFRPFVSQLRAMTNCFLDDLFVDPAARGSGAAQALIGAVKTVAQDKGWGTVRWITAEDNYRGRAVYDKLATRTPWVTYDIKL
ncbi:Acetyltransferase (GNAT) family protein [Sulfitobacter marinus]|uniref:Acetyltransferase (GNAT) family protein n=1 Tax=Sulfitobacter marinus TaxID=394264 RepID=A0A1I6QW91_9RHOB|nr:GNAT family N-acetyltransferase [Sulfitobacter marinus]SFS56650.1 Acetyltransferase (GNAT) family protein [Sulfitobacter marinus]